MAQAGMITDVATMVDEHGVLMLRPETESVPEHAEHARLVDMIYAGLAARFAGRDDVAVHERLAWFPERENTRIRLDPDVMVVIGRPPASRKSYKAWAEEGTAPTVLIEVWSEDDTDAGYRHRLRRAREYGVREVVFVSPFAPGGCRVSHLVADGDGPFRTVATSTTMDAPVHIETLGIQMAGGDDLTVTDESGVWADTAHLAEQARHNAEQARHNAEQARHNAEQARRNAEQARAERDRADRLADALRAAGIDPDTI